MTGVSQAGWSINRHPTFKAAPNPSSSDGQSRALRQLLLLPACPPCHTHCTPQEQKYADKEAEYEYKQEKKEQKYAEKVTTQLFLQGGIHVSPQNLSC
jgi:hypothetical protein